MPQIMIAECHDYETYRRKINNEIRLGAILNTHLTRFTEGGEIDLLVHQELANNNCIEIILGRDGKVVGVVATLKNKGAYGCNMGKVSQPLYDRDDRTFKRGLNKVKGFFKGEKDKGYVDRFTQQRIAYNRPFK